MSKKKENKSFVPENELVPDNELVPEEEQSPSEPGPIKNDGYEVCRGVGVPPRTRRAQGSKYPLENLEVGDGIKGSERTIRNVSASARSVTKRTGFKFSVRRDPTNPRLFLIVRSE